MSTETFGAKGRLAFVRMLIALATLSTLSGGGIPGAYASDPPPPIDVFVGYADNLRASPFFPVPWEGDANVLFIGSGPPSFDAGAVRIDNRSGGALLIDNVTVTLCEGRVSHSLWGSFTIPPDFSAILTQTNGQNFDTSDECIFRICRDGAPPGTTPFPKILITIAGVTTEFDDTAHVLDTGGFDLVCVGNESLQWRAIGTCGVDCPGGTVCGNGMCEAGETCAGCPADCGPCNRPPDCSGAVASPGELWPPNHKFVAVSVAGVTDPDGDPVTIAVTGITQDEPLNSEADGNTCPDATGAGTGTASLRAERAGTGDGRVYHVSFGADDGRGGQCGGSVAVCVPHDQRPDHVCVDQGPLVDSTGPCS